jgi:hypothetical protein
MKNKIIAIIGGTIALFGLGYLTYQVLGLHAAQGLLAEMVFAKLDLPFIILMEVLYAALLTIIYMGTN